jgi:flagellar hook protein FlgE
MDQNGGAQGRMEGYNVDASGLITVSYSNGLRTTMGQVLLATFPSSENLAQIGANQWRESVGSGPVALNTPGVGGLGVLQSSSKEESNVDLTSEMIKMITAQRIFQAAAEMVKKQDETLQTVVNLARS